MIILHRRPAPASALWVSAVGCRLPWNFALRDKSPFETAFRTRSSITCRCCHDPEIKWGFARWWLHLTTIDNHYLICLSENRDILLLEGVCQTMFLSHQKTKKKKKTFTIRFHPTDVDSELPTPQRVWTSAVPSSHAIRNPCFTLALTSTPGLPWPQARASSLVHRVLVDAFGKFPFVWQTSPLLAKDNIYAHPAPWAGWVASYPISNYVRELALHY
jgi:hypothetical protein